WEESGSEHPRILRKQKQVRMIRNPQGVTRYSRARLLATAQGRGRRGDHCAPRAGKMAKWAAAGTSRTSARVWDDEHFANPRKGRKMVRPTPANPGHHATTWQNASGWRGS